MSCVGDLQVSDIVRAASDSRARSGKFSARSVAQLIFAIAVSDSVGNFAVIDGDGSASPHHGTI